MRMAPAKLWIDYWLRNDWNALRFLRVLIGLGRGKVEMSPAVFVIAIFGCGEADAPCEHVATAPAQYASFAECTRATEEAIAGASGVDFPVVVAQCKSAGAPASLQIDADEIKLPEPDRRRPTPFLTRADRPSQTRQR